MATFQNSQQVRDGSPGSDARILPQPLSSGASNKQVVDSSTKPHESIAQWPQQQQPTTVQNVSRQSAYPVQHMDVSASQALHDAASSRHTPLPQQQQTMQQSHSHLASQQLPNLHTTVNTVAVQPSHVNVVSPLPPEQIAVTVAAAQQQAKAQQQQQPAAPELIHRSISQCQQPLAMDVTQQHASVASGDGSFQNQQHGIQQSTSVQQHVNSSNIQKPPQQLVVTALPPSIINNQPPASGPMQSQQNTFNIQSSRQDYPSTGIAPQQQPISSVVEPSQVYPIQQPTNVQQMAQHPPQQMVPQQNIGVINLQQQRPSVLQQQSQQLPEQQPIQIRTTLPQPQQQEPTAINIAHTTMTIQNQAPSQDHHMQAVRIMPNVSSQQSSGDVSHAQVYVATQTTSGSMSDTHSSKIIQQNITPQAQPTTCTSSINQAPLQKQASVPIQGSISTYMTADQQQGLRQAQQQSPAAVQLQQSTQTRQFVQQQQQQAQVLPPQQTTLHQSVPTQQQQQQHQQQQQQQQQQQ